MTITPLYAALLGLFFVALSARTIMARRKLQIALGDNGDPSMLRAIRVHANFAEYVPISLILLALVEGTGAASWFVHLLGTSLLLGRLSHAFGVSQVKENFAFRVSGVALTLTTLTAATLYLLARYVVH